MAVLEMLSERECYLHALLSDLSGIDQAEFMWYSPDAEDGCFRAWPFQWPWMRCEDKYQIDQSARSVGKSLSIKLRGFAFPFNFAGEEMVVTAPELIHLEPIVSLIENQIFDVRLTREMLKKGRTSVNHRPFMMQFQNGSRIMGRIPQRDGRGVQGCVAAGSIIMTRRGFLPVEDVRTGDEVWTHKDRWRPVLEAQSFLEDDVWEVRGQGMPRMIVSGLHRFLVRCNQVKVQPDKTRRELGEAEWCNVTDLVSERAYWGSPATFEGKETVPEVRLESRHNAAIPMTEDFWWLVGRYLADGYLTYGKRPSKRKKPSPYSRERYRVTIVVVPGPDQDAIVARFGQLGRRASIKTRAHSSADLVQVSSTPWGRWLEEHCGSRAENKRLPPWMLFLPEADRRAVLAGYLSGDGDVKSTTRQRVTANSVSKGLVIGMKLLAQSVGYSTNYGVLQPKTTHVRGVALKKEPRLRHRLTVTSVGTAIHEGGAFWSRVHSVNRAQPRMVFNPVVADDHSYIADGTISHNTHPRRLEQDEAAAYPERGWTELGETLKRGSPNAQWRAHGVTRGIRGSFFDKTQPDSGWTVHRITAMSRPNWTAEERAEAIRFYGSTEDPDYRRNVLGLHGDAAAALFVLRKLMRCQVQGTGVWLDDAIGIRMVPIESVQEGDVVANAAGRGKVTAIASSRRADIVGIGTNGHRQFCTADHPVFTARGWVEAGRLREGDYIVTREGMRALWRAVEDALTDPLLLSGVLSGDAMGRDASHGEGVRGLWRTNDGQEQHSEMVLTSVLEAGLRQTGPSMCSRGLRSGLQASREVPDLLQPAVCADGQDAGATAAPVPALWQGTRPSRREAVLRSTLLERVATRVFAHPDLSGMSAALHEPTGGAVLLASLLREMDGPCLSVNADDADDEILRALRRGVLSAIEGGPLLLAALCQPAQSAGPVCSSRTSLQAVRQDASTEKGLPSVLQYDVLGAGQTAGPTAQAGKTHASQGSGRAAAIPVPALERAGRSQGRMAAAVLDEPAWRTGRRGVLPPRSRVECQEAGCGSRWARSQLEANQGEGPASGQMAAVQRVESVEILERGDPDFDRLSGGEDTIAVYDLTVSGHPSFFVGEDQLLVHNCTDIDKTSDYNDTHYHKVYIRDTDLDDPDDEEHGAAELITRIGLPEVPAVYRAKGYQLWSGADLGWTSDPTEILTFVEYHPDADELAEDKVNQRGRPQKGHTRVRLLSRISLRRISAPLQAHVVMHVMDHYKVAAFSMDSTGAGLPLFQFIQAMARASAANAPAVQRVLERIKGYNFSEKVLVEISDEQAELLRQARAGTRKEATQTDIAEEAGIERLVLEQATDNLRQLVDQERLMLPYDRELIDEYHGQTVSYSNASIDAFGRPRRQFSSGKFHALDASRMAVMGMMQQHIEELMATQNEQGSVIDRGLDY